VDADPGVAAAVEHGDLRISVVPPDHAPQRGGREVAQDGGLAARLDGAEKPGFEGEARVPDGVDTAV
jgi:hypothetical protein